MANVLVTVWICCTLAIIIMCLRLLVGRICKTRWDVGDSLTVLAILCSMARIAFTHVVVIWSTNNFSDEYRATHRFTAQEIEQREIGAKCTLVARSLYICLLWIQKCVLLTFYRNLVKDMPWGKPTMRAFLAIFAATFSVSIIFTFVECRPFELYWSVFPDPGSCAEAIEQLYVVGFTNIFTDLMLICLPIPILLKVRLNMVKKFQLGFLFSMGFLVVIMTAIRIPLTVRAKSSESTRISWTTAEFLVATFVANAPTLYSFRHLFKRRTAQPMRRFSRSAPHIRDRGLTDLEETAAESKTDVVTTQIMMHATESTDHSGETLVEESGGREAVRP